MKTAIVLAGHMRSFDKCLPAMMHHVFRHFPGAEFFVTTEPDEDAWKVDLLKGALPKSRVEVDLTPQPDLQPVLDGLPIPKDFTLGERFMHEPYFISVPPLAVLGQLWRLWQVLGMLKFARYQRVVRLRPDLFFHSYTHREEVATLVPWWGRFGGINDRFAILLPGAAEAYFSTYGNIRGLLEDWCPFHPESLIVMSMEKQHCTAHPYLMADFSTMRTDGTMRGPEISASDYAGLFAEALTAAIL